MSFIFKSIVSLIICLLFATEAISQRCEWLDVQGGASHDELYGITVDKSNNIVVCGSYYDTFSIGTYHLPCNTLNSNVKGVSTPLLIKYNNFGNVLWVDTLIQTAVECGMQNVITDNDENIYVSGSFVGAPAVSNTINFGNGVKITMQTTGRYFFLAKFNKNGIAQWARVIGPPNPSQSNRLSNTISAIKVDNSGSVYFSFSFRGTIGLGGTSQTLWTSSSSSFNLDIGIVKYSSSGVFVRANSYGSLGGAEFVKGIGVDDDANIYIAASSDSSFTFASKTLKDRGLVVLKLDSAFTPINGIKTNYNTIHNVITHNIGKIATAKNGSFVIVDNFIDSVNFGNNIWLKHKGSYLHKDVSVVYYDSTLIPKWARKSDSVDSRYFIAPTAELSIKNNNIYFGGVLLQGSARFGSSVINFPKNLKRRRETFFITKMDTLGNFLWAFANDDTFSKRSVVTGMDIDGLGGIVLTGYFWNKIKIFNKTKTRLNNSHRLFSDIFTAQIIDFAISRGEVKSGPYCAGDILKIPYTKFGEYNIGNEFIAELSDSAGNFDGGHRELGRIKDTASGIINGALPLFNVATTNKYRIRIISTDPVVQSFYKKDTLRLLIYSRDTANAGTDQLICKGQQIKLTTTGGSKWLWTPTISIQNKDSSNRHIWVKPSDTIEYRIIISDSSGCGVTDTDYVKVYVRPYIEAKIQGESPVCRGYKQYLKATASGGDNSNYWYIWKQIGFNIILGRESNLFIRPANTTEYMIIVGDSCSDKIDTAYFTVDVETNLKVHLPGDTIICKGKPATLVALGSGCNPNKYTYEWHEKSTNTLLSVSDTLEVHPKTTSSYYVILRDTSTLLSDTGIITVILDTIINVQVSPDVTICKGKNTQIKAHAVGCDTSQMVYTWNNGLGKGKTKIVKPASTTTYTVIGENKFNGVIDTATITVSIDSIFNITTIPDSTICIGQTIDLTTNIFSCDTSNMQYTWTANNQQLSTNNQITVNPSQTTTYTLIGENTFNGLKDTTQVTITVRPKLELTINPDTTICIGEHAELRATATGGRTSTRSIIWSEAGSQWTVATPNTKVSPTVTTTYKAILSDGCTVNNDSATITVNVRPKLELTVNPDTTICIGGQAELRATANGGLATAHKIQWENNGQSLSNNPKLTLSPTQTSTYTAILSDNCTTPNDSAEITITVRPKLELTVNPDSTICIGEQAELRAIPQGGYTPQHQIQWIANNQQLSTNNIIQVTPTQTTTYQARLTDNCTTPNDSAELTITVRPPLQLTTAAKDSICSNEILLLTATPTGGYTPNHQIQWTTTNSTWTSNQNPATDTPQHTTTYIATLTDNCSPPVQDTLQVIVLPIPIADFTVNPTAGCPPLKITLQDNSQNNDSTQNTWTIGNTEYQSTQTQTHELLKQGTYSIKLNVKNRLGCSDEKTQQNIITVFEKPQADFIIKPDIKEIEEPLQLYNLSRNATHSIWIMGDGNQLTTPKDTTYKYHEDDTGQRQVQLIAINSQGCRDTAKQTILVYNKVHCSIPTAFTPNGDGLNNTFKPVCVGAATYTLTIYNRWGQVIYQQQNGAWDGNYIDQPVPMGLYMYKLQINAQSQKKKLTYGTVQLIR